MAGLFSGLEIGKRSLLAQQLAMFTAGHNIANVNTPGFARQRTIMASTLPLDLPDGRMGTGVRTVSVDQLRDSFLDGQFRREINSLGGWQAQERTLTQIELIFTEPRDNTIGDLMSKFWQSWQEVASEPSAAARNAVVEQGKLLVNSFHQASRQLNSLQSNLNAEIEKQAELITDIGTQIAALNKQIASGELGGAKANDLRDVRNLLLDRLSSLAQISITETSTGSVNVYIGSMEFVNSVEVHELETEVRYFDGVPTIQVNWGYSGTAVEFGGGNMGSLIDARDVWVAEAREALDALVETLVTQVNTLHRQGRTADGRTGVSFFDPLYLEAGSIQLNALLADNPQQNIVAGPSDAESDVTIAQALADLAEMPAMPDGRSTLNGYYASVIGTIGARSREAMEVTATQTLLVRTLENQRQSVMGTSLDEELANMIKFQHAYEAAARVITTMDEAIGTVIQRMGVVGR